MSFSPASSIAPATVAITGSVAVGNFPASQAVTGPLTDTQLRAAAVPVSGPLTDTQLRATRVPVDGSGVTQPVSGSVGVSNFPATQPVSAVSLPLPTGAAKDSTLTDGSARVGGTVTVDGSGHTQPVSGTVTSNQGTAGAAWPISAAALPLPSGAAKDSTLTDGSQRVGGVVSVDASGVPVPVTGPLTNAQLRAAAVPVDASSVAVPVTGPLTDAQLRATRVPVDGSGVTQPVSVASLPLPSGAATEAKQARELAALNDIGLTALLEREKIPA